MYANALSISANSEKKDAAFEYIKWTLENRDIQTNSVSLPVNKEISGDTEFLNEFADGAKHFNKQLALDALANSVTWRNTGTVAEINNNVIKPEIERLILKPDSTDLKTVLENIQTEGQKILTQNDRITAKKRKDREGWMRSFPVLLKQELILCQG